MSILTSQKKTTLTRHAINEARLDLLDHGVSLISYKDFLQKFFPCFIPLEHDLPLAQSGYNAAFKFFARQTKQSLILDRAAMGAEPTHIAGFERGPESQTLKPTTQSRECRSLIEKSILGGWIISRQLRKIVEVEIASGSALFNDYGIHIDACWKSPCVSLSDDVAQHDVAQHDGTDAVLLIAVHPFDVRNFYPMVMPDTRFVPAIKGIWLATAKSGCENQV